MTRRRQEPVNVRISDEEYTRLENKHEILRNEFVACRRKLDSKCEALLILSHELDQCRSERDQFKLMAEQLRERCQSMKKQTLGQPTSNSREYKRYTDMQSQSLAKLLFESKEMNKSLQFEHDDLKQKLHDAQGDIKLLREQIARQRVGTTDEGMTTRHFPAHEREELVQRLEAAKEQFLQLERDLQTVLDEKEELVTERDVYKTKYERLNTELNYILKGDENRVVDIDALVMENKYLQERTKQMEEEKSMALAAVSKYKSLLEKKKTKSSLKLGQSRGGGMIITHKQVQQVLDTQSAQIPSQQAMSDLQALAGALLDTVNDKNLALSHQRKTNKILGNRVAELEKKIKTLEVAGLWNVPSSVSASLEKLRQECDDVKTLIPRQMSDASETSELPSSTVSEDGDKDSELETVTPLDSTEVTPSVSPSHTARQPGHLQLEDLDLLPTKEVSCKPVHTDAHQQPDTVSEIKAISQPQGFLFGAEPKQSHVGHTPSILDEDPEYSDIPVQDIENIAPGIDSIELVIDAPEANTEAADTELSRSNDRDHTNTQADDDVAANDQVHNENDHVHTVNDSVHAKNDSVHAEKDCVHTGNDIVHTENDRVHTANDNVHTAHNGDLAAGDSVAVYCADITGESEDIAAEEASPDSMDNFIGENAEHETAEFYKEVQTKHHIGDGDHCQYSNSEGLQNEDNHDSEKIGLLMESMAQKMCNISHKADHPEPGRLNTKADTDGAMLAQDGEVLKETSGDSPTLSSPLLNSVPGGQAAELVEDEPHDVEC